MVGRVCQSYFRVHTCSDMFHLFRYVTIFILRSFLRRQESVPVCPTCSQLSIFRLFIFQFSISNFYLLFQFSIFQFEAFLRRQESVPDCPTSGQLSTFWQFFWEIHSHWCLAASLAITFFPNVFQLCTAIHFKMVVLLSYIKNESLSLFTVGETSKELDLCGLGSDIDNTWQHPVTQYNTK